MTTITGIDLPLGSPGGSVELLADLYLGSRPLVPADVFMLTAPSGRGAVAGTAPSSQGPLPGPELLTAAGKQLDGPGFWSYVDTLAAAIRARYAPGDYAVAHLQHLAFGATPALLRVFPKLPSIALVHGTDLLFAADHPTQRAVLLEATEAARRVVVPTGAMADRLRTFTSVRAERIREIPWGIPDHLLHAPPQREPRPDGEFRLLYAGRLTAEKATGELLAGLAAIDGATLSVAAPPAEFRALAAGHDLAGVRSLGWLSRAELWRCFTEHDLLVVPSLRLEAFGLVAVEAQACGLPVLYQPVPGLVEVLGDSALAADGEVRARPYAAAVARLMKDPAALDELRAAGRRNAARFPLSGTAAALRALSAEIAT